ncbi:MAG: tRNA (adenosine(37)-N6)-dimethylallyltransferase MiaA [Deltaproteobacteria bacterium]|nr:tRNA (adenosine(37)-N6)-dimethylallyltransferase MiaA [Deltaproteobacteria bacterium]
MTAIGKFHNLIVILGPTASGKTTLAVSIARRLGSEILSADSRQVYRGMDLGTGKDLREYSIDGRAIPYHLIDIVEPSQEYNLFEFQRAFFHSFDALRRRNLVPIMAGGTGLYIDAVVRSYRMAQVPENAELRRELEKEDEASMERRLRTLVARLHNQTDLRNRGRLIRAIEIAEYTQSHGFPADEKLPVVNPFVIGVRLPREEILRRIELRLLERLEAGMIEEVRRLRDGGLSWEKLESFGLEYRYIGSYLQGNMTYKEMVLTLQKRINQFSKRQMTWFRKMERTGVAIHWIDGPDADRALALIDGAGITGRLNYEGF